jgi:hypothetical protein
VSISLDDLGRALGGFLCPFGKSVKSHHRFFVLLSTASCVDPMNFCIVKPGSYRTCTQLFAQHLVIQETEGL